MSFPESDTRKTVPHMRSARLTIDVVLSQCVAVLAVRWVVRPARAWNRARVARELEGLFPRLGQRLRTATQHGGRPDAELIRDGVAPGMVVALEEETAEKVKPLPFQAALPVRPALVWGVVGVCCIAGLAAMLGGRVSTITTLWASVVPTLFTVTTYVTVVQAKTGFGDPATERLRFTMPWIETSCENSEVPSAVAASVTVAVIVSPATIAGLVRTVRKGTDPVLSVWTLV